MAKKAWNKKLTRKMKENGVDLIDGGRVFYKRTGSGISPIRGYSESYAIKKRKEELEYEKQTLAAKKFNPEVLGIVANITVCPRRIYKT